MEQTSTTLLIIEDDLEIANMLSTYFNAQGYHILTANWGEDGIKTSQTETVHLIILDIRLPDIDGFEVARQLRSNAHTRGIPIIFLTDQKTRSDRLKGLALQADDYITKPFDVTELNLRIRNAIERSKRIPLSSPVTGLPDGKWVDEQLLNWLEDSVGCSLLVISIRNLEWFREKYGFLASDDLLKAVAIILSDTLSVGKKGDLFLGHLSPTDFIAILPARSAEKAKERACSSLEKSFKYFYNERDREKVFNVHNLLGVQAKIYLPLPGIKIDLQSLHHELENIYR